MYDVGVALRRFKGLISYAAWRYVYAVHGTNSKAVFEDIQAEGLLTLVECCRSFPDGQTRFARYFKRSLYNRLRDLYRDGLRKKRDGVEVDIVEAHTIPEIQDDSKPDPKFIESIREKYSQISPLLSDDANRLLQLLLDPSDELVEYAWRDFCRKNKLRSQGRRVRGAKKFRIKLTHVRGVLHMTPSRMREVVVEVKAVHKKNQRGGS